MRTGSFLMLVVGGLLLSTVVQAERRGLSLNQTRVVFNAGAPSVSVTLRNHSDGPWLTRAQVLVDPNGTQAAPFMVTPPLFRLEPGSQSTVRILRQGTEGLPTDRESVFYLSLLTIPSSRKAETETPTGVSAQVTVGVDTVIKLFYRPTGLALTPQAAAEKLIVRRQGNGVDVTNPTPYYQTLATLILDGEPVTLREVGSMIAPFSARFYATSAQPRQASWTVINDYGGASPTYQTPINHGGSTL